MFASLRSQRQLALLLTKSVPKRTFVRPVKYVAPESYVKGDHPISPEEEAAKNVVKVEKYDKNTYKRGLTEDEKPIPTSPFLGPIRIEKPTITEKVYRWCSCGLALKQPFCDGSHKGTKFYPVRFTVEEKTKAIDVCGCKLTKEPPYCDGQTCVEMRKAQENSQ